MLLILETTPMCIDSVQNGDKIIIFHALKEIGFYEEQIVPLIDGVSIAATLTKNIISPECFNAVLCMNLIKLCLDLSFCHSCIDTICTMILEQNLE